METWIVTFSPVDWLVFAAWGLRGSRDQDWSANTVSEARGMNMLQAVHGCFIVGELALGQLRGGALARTIVIVTLAFWKGRLPLVQEENKDACSILFA